MLNLNSIMIGADNIKTLAEFYEWIATFSDPDGNYFQLMTPWES